MIPSNKTTKFLYLLPLVICCVMGLLYFAYHSVKKTMNDTHTAKPHGFQESITIPLSDLDIEKLQWNDIGKVTQVIRTSRDQISLWIEKAKASRNPVSIYLSALLLLADNQTQVALNAFNEMDLADIPPAYLYAPYRLQQQLHPFQTNPYLSRLLEAIENNLLPPLMQARIQCQEGKLKQALSAYLETDPAQWKNHDLTCFALLYSHQGYRSELLRMIGAALRAKRMSEKFSNKLLAMVAPTEMKSAIGFINKQLARDRIAAGVIINSATALLDIRKLFLQKDYKIILRKFAGKDPIELTTETVLILFLSSLHGADILEISRWSQEIKRRFPDQDTADWVNSLVWERN